MRTADFTSVIVSYSTLPPNPHARVRPWIARSSTPADSAIRAMRAALRRAGFGPVQDAADERLVLEQRRARGHVAYLLRGASHVDVDDLGAVRDVVAGGFGHHRRIGADDLDRHRRGLACMRDAQPRLARLAQLGTRRNHFGDREPGAEAAAKHAERTIGHACHRSNEQSVAQVMRA